MRFHVITIFPEIFSSYLRESILGRAIKNKLIKVEFYNPRNFIKAPKNNYRPVDDRPYGGGPGMVMRAEPILKAVKAALHTSFSSRSGRASSPEGKSFRRGEPRTRRKAGVEQSPLIINFVPSAEKFTTEFAKKVYKRYTDIILICGRYEGIDTRVDKILKTKKISVGDYVLTGGEIPAMVLIDSISRQIPGVLGKYVSLEEERVSSSEVYTRPEILKYKNKNYRVPKVLLSGHRAKIEEWKKRSR